MNRVALTLGFAFLACLSMAQSWTVQYAGTNNTSEQIYWTQNGQTAQYGVIDLTSAYMRMNYGPGSGWASSIDVMPIFWSGGNLYQGYPVTETHSVSGSNLLVKLTGKDLTLTTKVTLTFYPPYLNHMSALVQGATTGTVPLDTNRPGEAFKPIFISSMNDSSTSWDSQTAFAGTTVATYPNSTGGWIIPGSTAVSAKSWGVVGGTSSWNTNASTISITSTNPYAIAGYLSHDTNPNDDNVGFWASTTTVPTSWTFTATASNGPSGGQNWNLATAATGSDGKNRILWNATPFGTSPNEMALWRIAPGGSPVGILFPTSSYGTPLFITVTPDGHEHILLMNLSGVVSIYHVSPNNTYTVSTHGAHPGWTPTGMGAQPNGDLNVFWTNVSGEVAIWDVIANTWSLNPSGLYGPNPNWTAYAFATGPTGMERVFWQQSSAGSEPGEMSLYRVTSPGPASPTAFSSLAAGWLPSFMGVGPNNYERVFFSNSTTGQSQLWNLSPTNVNTVVTYGAHPGWWPTSLSMAPNNDPELMWVNNDGELSTWDINPAGTPASTLYGPY